jgi:hypothetical protein
VFVEPPEIALTSRVASQTTRCIKPSALGVPSGHFFDTRLGEHPAHRTSFATRDANASSNCTQSPNLTLCWRVFRPFPR